jgi:glycosyltransferase involved in cell wall biosynthesis
MMKEINIIVFSRYSELGASSRLRMIQYLPFLANNNINCSVNPFFNERYLKDLYSNKKINLINLIYLFFQRFVLLFSVKKYDLVWIEKEVFPYMPSFFESIICYSGVKYIVDYDDDIFQNYDKFNSNFYKKKFHHLLQKSSLVVVCNDYLFERVNFIGAKNIIKIPTVVDMLKYKKRTYSKDYKEFRIGWIGSPSTTKYLYVIKDVLEKLALIYPIKLIVVGGTKLVNFNIPLELHEWSPNKENEIIETFDIGVMPLYKTRWEEGKCGYKLIQYMASGVPVIATCFGMNKEIVDKDVGFLVSNDKEWEFAFEYFFENSSQIKLLGEQARKNAEAYYSLQDWSKIMAENFRSLTKTI